MPTNQPCLGGDVQAFHDGALVSQTYVEDSDITIHCVHGSSQMLHIWRFYPHVGQTYGKCREIFHTWSIWGMSMIVICFFLRYSILIFNTVAAYLERRFSPQWIDGYSTHMFQESVEWFGMTMYWRSAEKQIVALCQKVGFFHVFSQNPRNYLSHQIFSKNAFSKKKWMLVFQGMTLYDRKNLNSGGFCRPASHLDHNI